MARLLWSHYFPFPALVFLCAASAFATDYAITIPTPPSPGQPRYMGEGPGTPLPTASATSRRWGTLSYNNSSLLLDGKPILPVMGEFHFSRFPAAEWRDELLKMKAGGITTVATYVFWIHHEEIQGKFDWSDNKDLRKFVQTCSELNLPVIIRMGPWCHGEVRNGGFPDWADAMPKKRSEDPDFLAAVKPLYGQIADQLKGLLWKDGGPVMGIQVDNEFGGNPAYLLALKKMARDSGILVPLYIKTGWPQMRRPVPFGELMPLFGAYAEGFWDRSLDPMPGNYWQAFTFSTERLDTAIASDIFGNQQASTQPGETLSYPFLTCELGGGMMTSYHRRIKINPYDALALSLVKVGSGSNLPGYYMYHGGTNPDGKTTTVMQETQSRGMWNDLPYKTYDFQAPLGEFGQVREPYHLLRRFHMFLHDFGPNLAPMPAYFPSAKPSKNDATTLRYSVRSDGKSGFLFVNNYQRGLNMPLRQDVQFKVTLSQGRTVDLPENGSENLPANSAFIWPINLDLGGAVLHYSNTQPLCTVKDGDTTVTFFVQTPGVQPFFSFDGDDITVDQMPDGTLTNANKPFYVMRMKPNSIPLKLHTKDGRKQMVVLLDEETANQAYKATIAGIDHVFFTKAHLTVDGTTLRLTASNPADLSISAIPPLQTVILAKPAPRPSLAATFTQTQSPGPLRTIKMGSQKVAEQPTDDDFASNQPAIYTIKLPSELAKLDKDTRVLLRLHYTGDVARFYVGDKLITDNFYNSTPFDIGLWRLPPNTTRGGELTLKILPLQKNAPIYLADWPDFQGKDARATLDSVELVTEQSLLLRPN